METKMTFYHGTTEEAWKKIQEEKILFGVRNAPSRCTYLTPLLEEAKKYGEVILEVLYDPEEHLKDNNYIEGCWQFRVYEPIPIEDIKRTMNDFPKEELDQYLSLRSKIWRRCMEVAEYYFESGLWVRGINYISDFEISSGTITIIEQAHGMDLEFSLEDFMEGKKLEEAIRKDHEEYNS